MLRSRQDWYAAAALAALTFAVFSPALEGDFVNFDDFSYVYRNPNVLNGLSGPATRWAFTTFQTGNWHPLTWLSLQLDASLWKNAKGGPDPAGFHRTSVLLHAANAALLFLALRALTGVFWRSVAVATLFAVHPLRVESVAWVAERKDVLSICFGLLALLGYAFYVRRPSLGRYALVALALALSLLAKPTLVTLPFLMLVLDWWPLRRLAAPVPAGGPEPTSAVTKERSAGAARAKLPAAKANAPADRPAVSRAAVVLEKLPLLALVAASSVITFIAQADQGAVANLEDAPLAARLANVTVSYGFYLGKTAWPVGLAAFYPLPDPSARIPALVAAATVLVAATAAAWLLRKRAPYLLTGWLWYLGTLVPVIGLVQVGLQAYADRYSYFPQIGILLAVCWGVADLAAARPRVAVTAAGVAVAACAVLTVQQIAVWHDSVTLWTHALSAAGKSATVLANLAETVEQGGQPEQVRRAGELYREAVVLAPRAAQGHINLGNNYKKQGRYDDAAKAFAKVCELMPDSPIGYTNLGTVYDLLADLPANKPDRQKLLDRAVGLFDKACEVAPTESQRYLNAGMAEEKRENFTRAAERFQQAIDRDPDSPQGYTGLGVAYLRLGDRDKGMAEFRRAIAIDPSYDRAYTLLGQALMTQKPPDPDGAASAFETVTRISPKLVSAWYNLGIARLAQKRLFEAAECFATAAEQDPPGLDPRSAAARGAVGQSIAELRKAGRPDLADQIERRVQRLLGSQPGAAPRAAGP